MTFVSGLSKAELRLSSSSLKEGDTLTTKVATSNVKPGTTLFWKISGTGINASDFSSGSLSGSGSVDRSGAFSFSHTLSKDLSTEGRESFTVLLFSDKALSNAVAKAAVSIADTSTTPAVATPSYNLSTSSSSLKDCLLYTSPSPRDLSTSRMPSSA